MSAFDVGQFVAKIEPHGFRTRLQRVEHAAEHHHVVPPQELGGERIEYAVTHHDVGLRWIHFELAAALVKLGVQIRKLRLRQQHRVAAQMGNECRVHEQVRQQRKRHIDEDETKGQKQHRYPDQQTDREHGAVESLFVLMDI